MSGPTGVPQIIPATIKAELIRKNSLQNHLTAEPLRLITIAISHYCEKVRWALDKQAVSYIEEPHAPLFHRIATRSRGGKQTVPVLLAPGGTLSDSTAILQYLDTLRPSKRLYPAEPQLRRQVDKLEDLFDTQLGPATRRWAYSYLLNHPNLVLSLWRQGASPFERAVLPVISPLICRLVRQRYAVTATSAATSYENIKRLFQQVNRRLADGRSYLVGDRFSAADLTFAALAAPALQPANYGPKHYRVERLRLNELPQAMTAQIQQLRETPAGAYALRLFREDRHRPGNE